MTYLTDEQVALLLKPIHPKRVRFRDGMSHVEGYDIRAELTRVFGFCRWSSEVLEQAVLCERETKTKTYTDKNGEKKGGHPAWYIVYRSRIRLMVHAPDGTLIAFHDGSHVGASTHPDFGEAHGNALTNSETYALRRAAINLGDQFGLSLYNKGSLEPCVRWTLVRPDAGAPKADTEDVLQVNAEEPGSASGGSDEEEADGGESAKPADRMATPEQKQAITLLRGDLGKPEINLDDLTYLAAARAITDLHEEKALGSSRQAAVPPQNGATGGSAPWERPWPDMATEAAARLPDERAGGKLWKEAAAKARQREISREEAKRVQDLITARVEDLRIAAMNKALLLLSENDDWRSKVQELADEESARSTLLELGQLVTADKIDMTRANRISHAIAARWPNASKEAGAAA